MSPWTFSTGPGPTRPAAQYGNFWGEKCAWVSMAHQAGVDVSDPKAFPAARQAIEALFPEELAFLRAMPTILLHEHYLFVHGGVPREHHLETLSARACMKNDAFLDQGAPLQRWVVVGHWRVTLYHPDIPSAKPLLLPDRAHRQHRRGLYAEGRRTAQRPDPAQRARRGIFLSGL